MKRMAVFAIGIILITIVIVASTRRKSHLISPVVEVVPTVIPTAVPASESAVLGFTLSASESASPSATPTAKPSLTKTLSPKLPSPTPTPTPVPATSKEVNSFIDRFAGQYGIDPNVLRYMALCESGFNSSATQSKYVGLYQFDAATWKNIRKELGEETNPDLRYSAEESVQTAAYAMSKGKSSLWPNCIP